MADLPEPVDITTSVSRPARTDSIASRCPGRSASKPNVSRATCSIGGLDICTSALSRVRGQLTPAKVLPSHRNPSRSSDRAGPRSRPFHFLEDVLLEPPAGVEGEEQGDEEVHQW